MDLKRIVNSDPSVIEDIRYKSLFDDKKRMLYFYKNIKIKHNDDNAKLNIWNLLELFVCKDLRNLKNGKKEISEGMELYLKNNSKIIYKVFEYKKEESIILRTELKDVKYFTQYSIIKVNNKIIKMNFSEIVIYPFIVFGPKGSELKHNNSSTFKILSNNLEKYLNNNYIKNTKN